MNSPIVVIPQSPGYQGVTSFVYHDGSAAVKEHLGDIITNALASLLNIGRMSKRLVFFNPCEDSLARRAKTDLRFS